MMNIPTQIKSICTKHDPYRYVFYLLKYASSQVSNK